jgi:hypothetical protein
MLPPFLSAALAPTALAGLLALVPGTSQAAPAAAGSPVATAQKPVLSATTVGSYSAASRAVPRDNHVQAGTSQTRPAVANATRTEKTLGHSAAAKTENKQATHARP